MACLAGITQYPWLYNPRTAYYGTNKQAVSQLNERINTVLKRMYTAGYISKSEMDAAMNDTFKVKEKSDITKMYKMPHFVEYAVYDVVTHLLRNEGLEDNSQNRSTMENNLRKRGYKIYTTVDPTMQDPGRAHFDIKISRLADRQLRHNDEKQRRLRHRGRAASGGVCRDRPEDRLHKSPRRLP